MPIPMDPGCQKSSQGMTLTDILQRTESVLIDINRQIGMLNDKIKGPCQAKMETKTCLAANRGLYDQASYNYSTADMLRNDLSELLELL